MKPEHLLSIGIFTVATVISIYFWIDRWHGVKSPISEAFTSTEDSNQKFVSQLIAANEPVPTDEQAVAAHQTLLRYIRNDFNKGIKFVVDLRDRFFGPNVPLRADLDTRTLMDDYMSPLQRK